jgi:hypothetical protein
MTAIVESYIADFTWAHTPYEGSNPTSSLHENKTHLMVGFIFIGGE